MPEPELGWRSPEGGKVVEEAIEQAIEEEGVEVEEQGEVVEEEEGEEEEEEEHGIIKTIARPDGRIMICRLPSH